MNTRKTFSVLILGSLLVSFGSCDSAKKDKSQWLFKVDEQVVTTDQFNQAYKGYLYVLAQRYQLTPEKLLQAAEDPNTPLEQRQALQAQISKEAFLDQYKTFIILQQEAKKSGALDKPDFAGVVDFANVFFVANYFLVEQVMKEDANISEEDAARAWAEMRRQDPRLAHEPIERGLQYAKQQLEAKFYMEKQTKILADIKESYKIEKNQKVDLKKLLGDSNEKEAENKPEEKKQDRSKK